MNMEVVIPSKNIFGDGDEVKPGLLLDAIVPLVCIVLTLKSQMDLTGGCVPRSHRVQYKRLSRREQSVTEILV